MNPILGDSRMNQEREMTTMPLHDAIELIEMEYLEMPDLRLTFWQAQRLWNLSADVCERALAALICAGFLTRTTTDDYVRSGAPTLTPARIEALLRAM
jgi:hypothetical protein